MAKVGVYVCHCGTNIAGVIDVEEVRKFAEGLPDVVVARKDLFMCSNAGQEIVKQDIQAGLVDRVVVASCTPRTHEPIFRSVLESAGLNKYLLEMANIRDQGSWVHPHDKEGATEKAKQLVASAVAKAVHLEALEDKFIDVTKLPWLLVEELQAFLLPWNWPKWVIRPIWWKKSLLLVE